MTDIEWTRGDDGSKGETWNPSVGCSKVSPGCDRCYAVQTATVRAGHPNPKIKLAFEGLTHRTDDGLDWTGRVNSLPDRLDKPLTWKKPRRIFVNSLSDLFHEQISDKFIAQVFAVMAATPQHTYQLLTKRHGRMRSLLNNPLWWQYAFAAACRNRGISYATSARWGEFDRDTASLPNVWLGVSAEDQKWADIRIPALLATPAAVRFVSAEPLLGPIALHPYWLHGRPAWGPDQVSPTGLVTQDLKVGPKLDWLVAGGESGHGARPMHPTWVRSLRDQCIESDTAFFFKQWGGWGPAPWRIDREPNEPVEDFKARSEAVCATHAFAVWGHRYGHQPYKPTHKPWSGERTSLPDEQAPIRKWVKKVDGRELDGQEWNQFPQVAAAVTS